MVSHRRQLKPGRITSSRAWRRRALLFQDNEKSGMNNEGYEIRWVQNTCDRLAILTVMEPQRHLTLLPANNGPLSTGKVIRIG